MRSLLLILPLLLFHLYLGLALRSLANRTGAGPRSWAWAPLLNLVLLFRIAGRSPVWALALLLPGVNLAVWALAWSEIAARVGRSAWLGLATAVPGPNLPALGRVAGLRRPHVAAATALLVASVPVAWSAHASRTRDRVAALSERLGSAEPETRCEAALALAELGSRAGAALPALEHALGDPEPAVRGQAARALALVAPELESLPAAPRLDALLEAVRGSAGWRLPDAAVVAALAAAGSEAVPHLQSALRDPDAGIRWHAAGAFVRLGRRGAASASALLEAMRDPEWNVRNSAGRALEEVAGPEHTGLLAEALVEPSVETRYHAARALARLGPRAADALPALLQTLTDEDWEVRMESCWAVAAIGPSAIAAKPSLLRALADADPQVRAAAAWSLAHIGAGRDSAESLRPLLRDPDRDVRESAGTVLRRIEGPG